MDVVGIDKKKCLPCCPVQSAWIKRLGKRVCSEQKLQRRFPGFDQGQSLAVSGIFASGLKPSELPS